MLFLDPKTDIAFKKLFGDNEHKGVLMSFLNSVLDKQKGEQIIDVIFNDPHNQPEALKLKRSIVDIRVTDEKGKNYIIEMQLVEQEDFAQRCQYYSAVALARQIPKRGKYNSLMPVIFIGVVNFKLFPTKDYLSHHVITDQATHKQSMYMQEFHFIELKKFNLNLEDLKTILEKWVYLLKNAANLNEIPKSFQKNETMQEAFHILNKLNWTSKELDAYDAEKDAIWSHQTQIETAEKKGKEEEKIEIAKKALAKGMGIQDIIELTGLSKEEIKKLQD